MHTDPCFINACCSLVFASPCHEHLVSAVKTCCSSSVFLKGNRQSWRLFFKTIPSASFFLTLLSLSIHSSFFPIFFCLTESVDPVTGRGLGLFIHPSPSICLFQSVSAGEVLRPMLIDILTRSIVLSSSFFLLSIFSPPPSLAFFLFLSNWKKSFESFQLRCCVIFTYILPCSASFSSSSFAFKSMCLPPSVRKTGFDSFLQTCSLAYFTSISLCHSFVLLPFTSFLSVAV